MITDYKCASCDSAWSWSVGFALVNCPTCGEKFQETPLVEPSMNVAADIQRQLSEFYGVESVDVHPEVLFSVMVKMKPGSSDQDRKLVYEAGGKLLRDVPNCNIELKFED